jgi:hypothetical protein
MFRLNRATQADDISSGIGAGDIFPARIFSPVFFQSRYLLFACQCHEPNPFHIGVIEMSCSIARLQAKTYRLLAGQGLRCVYRVRGIGLANVVRGAGSFRHDQSERSGLNSLVRNHRQPAERLIDASSPGTTSFQSQSRQTALWAAGTQIGSQDLGVDPKAPFSAPD